MARSCSYLHTCTCTTPAIRAKPTHTRYVRRETLGSAPGSGLCFSADSRTKPPWTNPPPPPITPWTNPPPRGQNPLDKTPVPKPPYQKSPGKKNLPNPPPPPPAKTPYQNPQNKNVLVRGFGGGVCPGGFCPGDF